MKKYRVLSFTEFQEPRAPPSVVQLAPLPMGDVGENRIQKILEDKGDILITQTIRLVLSITTESICILPSKDRLLFSYNTSSISTCTQS